MKRLIVILFLLSMGNLSEAQIKVDFNLGLQMGNTSYSNNYPYFTTFKSGFFIGTALVRELNENWSLKTEAQFSQKGHKITASKKISFGLIETIPATRRYVEFIPTLERRLHSRLIAFAGPGYGYKISEQFSDEPMSSLTNRQDFFFHGGFHYYLDKTYLILSLKRSFTESDGIIYTNEEGNPIGGLQSRNVNVLFGMGFRI